jgi:hypothetical protein
VNLDDLPRLEFAEPGPVRDLVVAAILAGTKTTTTGLALALAQRFRLVAA